MSPAQRLAAGSYLLSSAKQFAFLITRLCRGLRNVSSNRATWRSKLPILEPSRRQAPQEERFDENGGCLHPLSAPFLGSAGNKTPIILWMVSNSRWGRPVLQLTPPDPFPSVTGLPTPRHFSLWDQGLGRRGVGCSAGTVKDESQPPNTRGKQVGFLLYQILKRSTRHLGG